MTADEFQTKAASFGEYKHPIYLVLGLNEECGELTGKIGKRIRKDGLEGWDVSDEAIKKEMCDVCWFVAELCTHFGWKLSEVMELNIAKLTDRKARGCICGSGDNR